ncbi:iron-sulfur cluster carrier protein ApbC [Sutterella faecalis]|uniref:Iron-sulfur cluster carrier protein n=2 Tax=Sutterella TaxID=40544 RepID=A0AAI9SCF5_9BURK|nr:MULTISPECIES: iron-sulfur cluster carrier protein ApbC [Sutterella]KAB7650558.1 iron-sulfur cluster carrier protein ApbC [Sutterella seckii]MBE5692672.1 iron-sulfur cluster carrier protein ApbC [Sutterella sp.]QDA54699.1 iron-sulfur cluster carrier protein ApbC [Sutterella faecalis]
MTISTSQVEERLSKLIDPVVGTDYVSARMLKGIETDDKGGVVVHIELGYPARFAIESVKAAVESAVKELGAETVRADVKQNIIAHKVQGTQRVLPGVKNIIAVSSGKGGVGKSTVSANLALALSYEGAKVGVLDADVYGPSQPTMLGAHGQPMTVDGKTMEPLEAHGIQINSVGFMVDEDEPMIWRGPMASGALNQLLTLTNWHDLDYLIVDMPPGTGDIQLQLSQSSPLTGAVVVTTPQDIALIDAKKGLRMFEKVNVPLIGIIENMSVFICPCCGKVQHIFGEGGAKRMSETYGVPLLGELPLSADIREAADSGNPTVAADPESPAAKMYRSIAMKIAGAVAKLGKDYSARMPTISVKND